MTQNHLSWTWSSLYWWYWNITAFTQIPNSKLYQDVLSWDWKNIHKLLITEEDLKHIKWKEVSDIIKYIKNKIGIELFPDDLNKLNVDKIICFVKNKTKKTFMLRDLDTFSVKWLSDDQIVKLIYNKTNTNIEIREGIKLFNVLFNEAKEFYKNEFLRNLPSNYYKEGFSSKKQIINFIKKTQDTPGWQINCAIAKIMKKISDFNNFIKSEIYDLWYANIRMQKYIKNVLLTWLQIDKNNFPNINIWDKDGDITTAHYTNFKISNKTMHFTIKYRPKTKESIIIKSICQTEYDDMRKIKDLFWLQIHVKNKEDGIYILEKLFENISYAEIGIWDTKEYLNMMQIKSKKFVDEKLLLSISNIDSTFYNLLQNSFSKSKEMSSIDYQDVKIAWKVNIPYNIDDPDSIQKPLPIEIQIRLESDNFLYSHERIRDWLKKILANIVLFWYVTDKYIQTVIRWVKEEKDIVIPDKRLFEYYVSKSLKRLYFSKSKWNKKVIFYTSKDRWDTLWDTELYPDGANIKSIYNSKWTTKK